MAVDSDLGDALPSGRDLQEQRERVGLSQGPIAAHMGVSRQRVASIEALYRVTYYNTTRYRAALAAALKDREAGK